MAQHLWSRLRRAEQISRVNRLHFLFRYIPSVLISRYFSQDGLFLKLLAYRSITQLQKQLLLKSRPRVIKFQDDQEFAQKYLAAKQSNSFSDLARQEIETSRLSPNQLERLSHVYFSSGAAEAGVRVVRQANAIRRNAQDAEMPARIALLLGSHWTNAMGHLLNVERFHQLCKAGELPYDRVVVVTKPFPIPNRTFLSRLVESTPNLRVYQVNSHEIVIRSLEPFAIHPSLILGHRGVILDMNAIWDRAAWMANRKGPESSRLMSDEIRQRGDDALKKWGIGEQDEIVCLHVRSGSSGSGRGLANADPLTYVPAIKTILKSGLRVIRMGDPSMPKLPVIPGLIDLAHSAEKSSWLDFYLWSRPKFAIGTCSGGSEAFSLFGIPTIFTNVTEVAKLPFSGKSFVLPKLFKRSRSALPMPITEFVRSPFGISNALRHSGYEDVEILENSPKDITNAVAEMEDLLTSGDRLITETPAQKLLMEVRQQLGRAERSVLSRSFIESHPYLVD